MSDSKREERNVVLLATGKQINFKFTSFRQDPGARGQNNKNKKEKNLRVLFTENKKVKNVTSSCHVRSYVL